MVKYASKLFILLGQSLICHYIDVAIDGVRIMTIFHFFYISSIFYKKIKRNLTIHD